MEPNAIASADTKPSHWSEGFTVRSFDADPAGRLRLSALVRAMQNAADGHARSHNLALDQLLSRGKTWVLREFHCEVSRSPRFLESCVVTTWASARSAGVRAWRDFLVQTTDGEVVATGTSLWLMLDSERRRPLRLGDDVLGMVDRSRACPLEVHPIAAADTELAATGEVAVHWLDLDNNGHVNNVRYIDWMLAAVPDAVWLRNEPRRLAIEFLDEAKPGDRIRVRQGTLSDGYHPFEIESDDGRRLCVANIGWSPR